MCNPEGSKKLSFREFRKCAPKPRPDCREQVLTSAVREVHTFDVAIFRIDQLAQIPLNLERVVVVPIDFYSDSGLRSQTIVLIGHEEIDVPMTTRAIRRDSRPFRM